jgi:hypothetical protein
MKVPQEIIGKVLALYKPNYRYLQEVEMEYPIARGRFQLGETEYCEALQHLTDVEAQLCLNQLCYVFFGQGVIDKRLEGFEDLTFDEYLELRKENVFVTESHKKFHRETNPRDPFYGQIQLMKIRRNVNLYVLKFDFDLNEGASFGKLSTAVKR